MNHFHFLIREKGHWLGALKEKRMIYHLGAIVGKVNFAIIHIRETVILYERNTILCVAKLGWNHDHTRPFTRDGCGLFVSKIK